MSLLFVQHCIHYLCIMNGTKGLTEGAGKPTHLCPCCLHKVFIFRCAIASHNPPHARRMHTHTHHSDSSRQQREGFDVEQRYLQLAEFFRYLRPWSRCCDRAEG